MTGRSQEELVAMLRSTKQGESVSVVVSRQEDIFLPRELVGEQKHTKTQQKHMKTSASMSTLTQRPFLFSVSVITRVDRLSSTVGFASCLPFLKYISCTLCHFFFSFFPLSNLFMLL